MIPTVATLVAFSIASFVLVIVPGPNVLYILGRGMAQGRRAAVVSALGIETGALAHVLAAVIGLSAIINSSVVAYETLRYTGIIYLFFLGIKTLRSRSDHESGVNLAAVGSARKIYFQGILVNVLNPKVTLFFLAFLPQFVKPGGSQTVQILVLSATFLAIATVLDLTYAIFSGLIGEGVQRRPALAHHQRYVSGVIFLGLAVLGAISGGRRSNA